MRIVEPPREIQNIKKPVWTSIKICYGCTTKCKLDPLDIDVDQTPFSRTFFISMLTWISHFWKCPVCSTINNFHSYSFDTYLQDIKTYKKLLKFKDTVTQHLTTTERDNVVPKPKPTVTDMIR
jgi:hypothetical protein